MVILHVKMVILHVKFTNKNFICKNYVQIIYYIIKHHNENVRVKRVHPRRGAKVFMCEDVYVFCVNSHLGRKCTTLFLFNLNMFLNF